MVKSVETAQAEKRANAWFASRRADIISRNQCSMVIKIGRGAPWKQLQAIGAFNEVLREEKGFEVVRVWVRPEYVGKVHELDGTGEPDH